MKYIIISSILASQLALADCDMRSASTLSSVRKVGPVTDLIKDTSVYGQCYVQFKLNVDGTWHDVSGTRKGLEQESYLCHYAVEQARDNLLLGLGGKFQTEAITVCKEGESKIEKIKIGDTILENEVGMIPEISPKYFKYRNSQCRLFREKIVSKGELRVNHGVICQIDSKTTNWLVMDKW